MPSAASTEQLEGSAPKALSDLSGATAGDERRAPPAHRLPLRGYVLELYLVDVVAASLAAAAAQALRFGFDDASIEFWDTAIPYGLLSVVIVLAWIALQKVGGSYEVETVGFGTEEYRRVMEVGLRLIAVVALLAFAFKVEIARGFVASVIPLTVVATLAGRWWSRRWLHRRRRSGELLFDVLAVGSPSDLADLAELLGEHPEAGYRVTAVLDPAYDDEQESVRVILNAVAVADADVVAVAAGSTLPPRAMRRLSWELTEADVQLLVAPRLSDLVAPRVNVKPVAGVPLLHLEQPGLSAAARILKGSIDRLGALVGLIVLAPLLIAIAIGVRATSPGPAIFSQPRLGRGGHWFEVHKFRTMAAAQVSAEDNEVGGLLFKIRGDPRVTPFGAFLRRFSLDELPQLFDVLRGEMSLVGPRPLPTAGDTDDLEATARRRVVVKPGMTGLWQVSGRSDLSWDESIRLDLHYVENWSLALDAVIAMKTLAAVLRGRGAY